MYLSSQPIPPIQGRYHGYWRPMPQVKIASFLGPPACTGFPRRCAGMPCVWRQDEDHRRIDRARCHSYLPRRSRSGLAPATHRTRTSPPADRIRIRGLTPPSICVRPERSVSPQCTLRLQTAPSGRLPSHRLRQGRLSTNPTPNIRTKGWRTLRYARTCALTRARFPAWLRETPFILPIASACRLSGTGMSLNGHTRANTRQLLPCCTW